MADLDVDGLIQNVKAMLSGLTTWQTLTGTSTAESAAEFIYEYGVEDECGILPLMILDLEDLPLSWNAGHLAGQVQILVRLELEIPEIHRGTYSAQARWFWQQISGLFSTINPAIQGSGELMFQGMSMPLKPGRIEQDTNNGKCEWMCMLAFDVYLK
jgi:hypothetical protein